ncbi:MAG: DUF2238 domain-containing protein [Verrucomicrobiae bacterium]|nr:DUF2238 domain-containing protein [Verrucomicrobiae bacterium]NNJ85645.1 DUF2238 domain-containing protein [Akkermansiaceae bacterium]
MKNSAAIISTPLIVFSALYMLVSVVVAFMQRNTEFVFYIVVMGVLITSLVLVHKRVHFSNGILWGMSLWGFFHMAGGLVRVPEALTQDGSMPVLYSWWLIPGWLKYDQLVHAFGFGVTTWVCWQILRSNIEKQTGQTPAPTFGLCLLSAAGGMGFGALNEVVEFVATMTIPETNVGGYVNTGWDLVFNLLGCSVVALVIRQHHRISQARRMM